MKSLFCNECNLTSAIPRLIAEELLGFEQLPLLESRYQVMRDNFDYNYAEWQGRFGKGMQPFRGYIDTTAVTIPITQQPFHSDFAAMNKGAIGLDLPTWFNIKNYRPRIMLIAQDPLRSNKWYNECHDAVISSPFGLHDATHRVKGNGGKMVYELVWRLASVGYGVYLTDAAKYFIYDHKTTDEYTETRINRYADILRKEIAEVNPILCVCFGHKAGRVLYDTGTLTDYVVLPHLSGTARGAIIRKFPELKTKGATVENIVELYANEIIRLTQE